MFISLVKCAIKIMEDKIKKGLIYVEKKHTLRFFIALFIVFAFAEIFFFYQYAHDIYKISEESNEQRLKESTNAHIELLLHGIEDDTKHLEEIAESLSFQEKVNSQASIAFLNKIAKDEREGVFRLAIDMPDGKTYTSDGHVLEIKDTTYLNDVMKGKIVHSNIEKTMIESGISYSTIVPVYQNGKVVAGLRSVYDPVHLTEKLNSSIFRGKSYFNIMNGDGLFLYQANHEKQVFQYETIQETLKQADFIKGSSYKQVMDHLKQGESGFVFIKLNGTEHELYYAPVGIQNWFIISELPKELIVEYSTDIQREALYLFTKVGACFIALSMVFFYARYRSEKQLKKNNRYFHNVMNCVPVPITIMDKNKDITFMNEAALQMIQKNLKDVVRKPCSIWDTSNCGTQDCAVCRLLHHQNPTSSFEKDGKTYMVNSSLLYNEKDEMVGFIETFQNITKAIEKEKEMASLIDNIPGGVLLCKNDEYCTIQLMSDRFLEICGYTKEEIQVYFQNSLMKMIKEEDRIAMCQIKKQANAKHQTHIEANYHLQTKHGYICIYHCGELLHQHHEEKFCNVLIDVTEQEKIKKQLEEKSQELHYISENMNGMMFVTKWNDKFDIIYANAGFKKTFGVKDEHIQSGVYLSDFILPQEVDLMKQLTQEQLMKRDTVDIQCRMLAKNRLIWVSSKGKHVVQQRNDEVDVIIWVCIDVSEEMKRNEEIRINEERYRIAVSNTQSIVFDYLIKEHCIIHDNDLIEQEYHIPKRLENVPEDIQNFAIIHEDDKECVMKCFYQIELGEKEAYCEYRLIGKGYRNRWFSLKLVTIFDDHHCPRKAVGILHDISEQKELEQLADKESTLRETIIKDAIDFYVIDLTRNQFLEGHENWKKDMVVPSDDFDVINHWIEREYIHPDDVLAFEEVVNRERLLNRFHTGRLKDRITYRRRIEKGSSEYIWVNTTLHLLRSKVTHDILAICNIQNITEEKEKEVRLIDQAQKDLLSGMLNKITTQKMIMQYLEEHPEEACAFFLIDIDNFKNVNDTLGHAKGDEVIHEISQRITSLFRSDDILGRIGGDEFVVFMKHTYKDIAERKAISLCEALRMDISNEKDHVFVSATIGVALSPTDGLDFITLYQHGDEALYRVKKEGKNNYGFYGE